MANLHGEGEHEFEADMSVFFLLLFVTGIPVIRKNHINQREAKSRKEKVVFVLTFSVVGDFCRIITIGFSRTYTQRKLLVRHVTGNDKDFLR